MGEDTDQSSQPPATKTVYIQAQESATFSIRCMMLPGYKPVIGNRLSFRVYIGGKEYCRRSIDIDTSKHKVLSLEGAEGVDYAGNIFVHPFQFAGVSLGMLYRLFVQGSYLLNKTPRSGGPRIKCPHRSGYTSKNG